MVEVTHPVAGAAIEGEMGLQGRMTALSVGAQDTGPEIALLHVLAAVVVNSRHALDLVGLAVVVIGMVIVIVLWMIDMMEVAMAGIAMTGESKYGSRDRYVMDRYPPSTDRFGGDRYGGSDRYPQSGYGKERNYDRDVGLRSSERYAGGGPLRSEGNSYRDRAGPYDRPKRGGGRPSSFDCY